MKNEVKKMNCYFDTSTYNLVSDDSKKDLIIKEINKRGMTIIPSVVNLCEILSTRNEERRKELLNVYEEIRNDYHALKPFTILLKDATLAMQEEKDEIEVNRPIEIDKDTGEICREAKSSAGKEFYKYNLGAREFIKKKSDEIKIPDAKSFFEVSDAERMHPFWIQTFIEMCKGLGIQEIKLSEDKILAIIQSHDTPWKYYLDSTLYIFYRVAFLASGHGRKSNPGGFDLEQCIYLCWADIFVLRDSSFYNFLKELSKLRTYNKKIFTYDEFRDYLGL